MAFEIPQSADSLVIVKLTGQLNNIDLERMQAAALEAIKQWGTIRVLVLLENFTGWERGSDWGDVSFIEGPGRAIEKLALVGDEKWKDLAYAFTAKGYRATSVEYFTPSERDRAYA